MPLLRRAYGFYRSKNFNGLLKLYSAGSSGYEIAAAAAAAAAAARQIPNLSNMK